MLLPRRAWSCGRRRRAFASSMMVTALIQSRCMRHCARPRWAHRAAAERCLPLPACANWAPTLPASTLRWARRRRNAASAISFSSAMASLATTAEGYKRVRPEGNVTASEVRRRAERPAASAAAPRRHRALQRSAQCRNGKGRARSLRRDRPALPVGEPCRH